MVSMDDWNIDGQKDLLAGGSGTFDEMMDTLTSRLDAFSRTNFFERDIGQGVEIVPCTLVGSSGRCEKESKPIWKKMLKSPSRSGGELSSIATLKKVTFDVEKFAADECGDAEERCQARARLAVKLGARPSKNNYINYKKFKEQLNGKKKVEVEFDKLSALKAVKKLSMKKKGKKNLSRK